MEKRRVTTLQAWLEGNNTLHPEAGPQWSRQTAMSVLLHQPHLLSPLKLGMEAAIEEFENTNFEKRN